MTKKNNINSVDRDDLFLLLQSYQNTVQSNMTLLEKQNILIEKQNRLLDSQEQIIDSMNNVAKSLSSYSSNLTNTGHTLETLIINKTDQIRNRIYAAFGVIGTIITAVGAIFAYLKV